MSIMQAVKSTLQEKEKAMTAMTREHEVSLDDALRVSCLLAVMQASCPTTKLGRIAYMPALSVYPLQSAYSSHRHPIVSPCV
jgi:hypothetical protein